MEDLRARLLAAFEIEHREHLKAIRGALQRHRSGEGFDVGESFRRAHSLKGASRAVDLPGVEAKAHALESLFAAALESGDQLTAASIERAEALLDDIEAEVGAPSKADGGGDEDAAPEFLPISAVRVQSLADSLAGLHTDLAGFDLSPQIKEAHAQAQALSHALSQAAARDPALSALARDCETLKRSLAGLARSTRESAASVRRSADRVLENMERVAMAPAASAFAGLAQMTRDLAAQTGIDVEVRVEGLDAEADRRLLQNLRDPVIHLLRNALAHGLEAPAERARAGKPTRGEIGLSVSVERGLLRVIVHDDGRGPDLDRIARTAVSRGLLPATSPRPSAEEVLAFAFAPGFSTIDGVGAIAGRGMGLSVVAEAARAAGGVAFMRAREPYGTEVAIETPVSAARHNLLFVEDGGEAYALPTFALERLLRVSPEALERLEFGPALRWRNEGNQIAVPVVSLARIVQGRPEVAPQMATMSIAVLKQGRKRLGLSVERLVGVRAAVVSSVRGAPDLVLGAADFERERLAVALNPAAVFGLVSEAKGDMFAPAAVGPPTTRRTILVVDDSITTRTLEKGILEASGYRVLVTVDGADALELLREPPHPVDLVVADVEMPRMDGYALLRAMKQDARLAKIPVVLMTSRAEADDVRRGMELGADAYLVKQRFDQRELLGTIGQLI